MTECTWLKRGQGARGCCTNSYLIKPQLIASLVCWLAPKRGHAFFFSEISLVLESFQNFFVVAEWTLGVKNEPPECSFLSSDQKIIISLARFYLFFIWLKRIPETPFSFLITSPFQPISGDRWPAFESFSAVITSFLKTIGILSSSVDVFLYHSIWAEKGRVFYYSWVKVFRTSVLRYQLKTVARHLWWVAN